MQTLRYAVALLGGAALVPGCEKSGGGPAPSGPEDYATYNTAASNPDAAATDIAPAAATSPAHVPTQPAHNPHPPGASDAGAPQDAGAPTGPVSPLRSAYQDHDIERTLVGRATYYHRALAGNRTACGDRYNPEEYTAAHRSLPFGTVVRVVEPDSGRDVYVWINDRGPFAKKNTIIDLSRVAAERIGLIGVGTMRIRAEVLELGETPDGGCGAPAPHD